MRYTPLHIRNEIPQKVIQFHTEIHKLSRGPASLSAARGGGGGSGGGGEHPPHSTVPSYAYVNGCDITKIFTLSLLLSILARY